LHADENRFTDTTPFRGLVNCRRLGLRGNYFLNNTESLSSLKYLKKLKYLEIRDNPSLVGSLTFLQDCKELTELLIGDTNINSGLEYFPENLEKIYCNPNQFAVSEKYKVGGSDLVFDYQS